MAEDHGGRRGPDPAELPDPVDLTDVPELSAMLTTDALLDALGRGEAGVSPAATDRLTEILAGLRTGLDHDYRRTAASGAFSTAGLAVGKGRRLARGSLVAAVGVAVALSATGVAAAVSADHTDALYPLHKLIFGSGRELAVDNAEHLLAGVRRDLVEAEANHGVSTGQRAGLSARLDEVSALVIAAPPTDVWRALAGQAVELRSRLAALPTLAGPAELEVPTGPVGGPTPDNQGGGSEEHATPLPGSGESPEQPAAGGSTSTSPSPVDGSPQPTESKAPDGSGATSGSPSSPDSDATPSPSPSNAPVATSANEPASS